MKKCFVSACMLSFILVSCGDGSDQSRGTVSQEAPPSFEAASLAVPDGGVAKVRGQLLYMPLYSNIPLAGESRHDLSAFVALHNTDLKNRIVITKVVFFDTAGKAVKDYLPKPRELAPLATEIFVLPKKDQSGPGANFLVEWTSSAPVTAPLVESVIKDLSGNMGLSFLSTGKVIREMK